MTVIQTEPAGATVYIDGRNAGPSPVEMADTKVVTSCTDIRIEKDGYQRKVTEICRDEQPAVGPIIGGFFLLVPWLWAYEYQPSHFYELKPIEEEKTNHFKEFQEFREFEGHKERRNHGRKIGQAQRAIRKAVDH